ncbi:unnamed protein product [Parnassius apollo]|uniref:(apollo) hypothetical protein n=1 Tax=Parnassius apollo TaxID=110799 RepID=A0A8S3XJB7_PARAO|nr:unnamed protein product [Parnassius apollo]
MMKNIASLHPLQSTLLRQHMDHQQCRPDHLYQKRHHRRLPLPGSTQSLFQSYLDKKYSHDRQEEEDPIIMFFKNLGHTVSQFSPDLRLRVKRAVFNIVCEAEENIQRNATVNISTPIASSSSSRQEYATDVDGSSSRQSYIILNTSQLQSVEGTSQMATSPLQSQTQNYASPLNEYIRFQK